jgi:hypothetical protein
LTGTPAVLAVALDGECVLVSVDATGCAIPSRCRLFEDGESWSHPAWAGQRLYVRGPERIECLDLSGD